MTLSAFFGQVFLLAAPSVSMFCMFCASDPRLVIFAIGGAFWWGLSALIASLWWYAIAPMHEYPIFGVYFGVIFQELVRWGFTVAVKFVVPAPAPRDTFCGVRAPCPLPFFHLLFLFNVACGCNTGRLRSV